MSDFHPRSADWELGNARNPRARGGHLSWSGERCQGRLNVAGSIAGTTPANPRVECGAK